MTTKATDFPFRRVQIEYDAAARSLGHAIDTLRELRDEHAPAVGTLYEEHDVRLQCGTLIVEMGAIQRRMAKVLDGLRALEQ